MSTDKNNTAPMFTAPAAPTTEEVNTSPVNTAPVITEDASDLEFGDREVQPQVTTDDQPEKTDTVEKEPEPKEDDFYKGAVGVDINDTSRLESTQPLPSLSKTQFRDLTILTEGVSKEDLTETEHLAMGIVALSNNLVQQGISSEYGNMSGIAISKGIRRVQPDTSSKASKKAALYSTLGIGSLVQVILPMSGFSLTLRPLSPQERVSLEKITQEGIGNSIAGLNSSNDIGLLVKQLVEFTISKIVVKTNLRGSPKDILQNLVAADYQVIILALLCVTSNKVPNVAVCNNIKGEPTDRPIRCGHTVTVDLDPTTFLNVLNLPDEAKQIIFSNEVTPADAVRYQAIINRPVVYKVTEDISITLKFPLMQEYFKHATKWAADTEDRVAKLVTDDKDERDALVDVVTTSTLTLYAHLFESAEINGVTYDKSTKGDIELILEAFSLNPDITELILEKLKSFISSINYIVGIPPYVCPSCENVVGNADELIIPLDIVHSFFVLRGMTTDKLKNLTMS